jgi:hypothetical protein
MDGYFVEKQIGWFRCIVSIFSVGSSGLTLLQCQESFVPDITNYLMSSLYSDSISPMFLTNHCVNKTFPASTKQNSSDCWA